MVVLAIGVDGQTISTAEEYLSAVADTYGRIDDYVADIVITRNNSAQQGRISYLKPNKIRIDYTSPARQLLVADGKDLWVYLPRQNIVLQQSMRGDGGVGLASDSGLNILRSNYSASYLTSPSPTPLAGTREHAVHLKLTWRTTREHFRELVVAVGANGYIRRIVGTPARGGSVQFDFTNIRINQGIPITRFDYDPPASASLYTDFLFDR